MPTPHTRKHHQLQLLVDLCGLPPPTSPPLIPARPHTRSWSITFPTPNVKLFAMSIPPRGKENSRLVSFQRGPEYFCTWGWATPLHKRRTRAGNRAHIGNRLSFCRTPSPSAATSRNPSRPQNLQTTQPPSLSMLPEPPPGLIEALKLRYFLIHGQAHPTEGPGMERYWIAAPARSFVFDNDATGYWVTDTSYIHVHHHRRTRASMILGYALDAQGENHSPPPPLEYPYGPQYPLPTDGEGVERWFSRRARRGGALSDLD
ncbi:hypothetical protein B0H11DRAFT_2266011 [Mycena galericulata]|nr:hypothetical protein B0H11DRAFT_2266011 [Mycena galericulata]